MIAISNFLWSATPLIVSLVTFVTYVMLGNQLTAEKVFASLGIFISLLRSHMV